MTGSPARSSTPPLPLDRGSIHRKLNLYLRAAIFGLAGGGALVTSTRAANPAALLLTGAVLFGIALLLVLVASRQWRPFDDREGHLLLLNSWGSRNLDWSHIRSVELRRWGGRLRLIRIRDDRGRAWRVYADREVAEAVAENIRERAPLLTGKDPGKPGSP